MSFLLGKGDAVMAFETFVLPGIEQAIKLGAVNRPQLHIVVLNPLAQYAPGISNQKLPILFEHSIGKNEWGDKQYDVYAQKKALISWRTGHSSRVVANVMPQLFDTHDFPHGGSAIIDGVIAAASGVQGYLDELFARMTCAAMIAVASGNLEYFKTQKNGSPFIPA